MAATPGYQLFPTALGTCGVAWSDRGVVAASLPEASQQALRTRFQRRFPGIAETDAPSVARPAIAGIVELLGGAPRDLVDVRLDMGGIPDFHQRVYEVAREVGPGQTTTYGAIATRLGVPGAARAVGQALGRNPFAPIVPCHRVVAANGRIGGFSAAGGVATKLRLLGIEGAHAETPDLFADAPSFCFDPAAALAHLCAVDAGLRRLIDEVGPFTMRVQPAASVFAALAEAIVHQQLNGRAAETIFARLRALFPDPMRAPTAEQVARASDVRLRGAGLSAAKSAALRDLARHTLAGDIPTLAELATMDDDTIVDRLTVVRGIGRWTVEMLLMFRLGRGDVLPADDFGIRKGFARAFPRAFRGPELPPPDAVLRRAGRWRPYRTVASWYLWRAAERG